MALDLTKIPPEARKELIAAGEAFGSQDTLAQAQKTLNALKDHRSKLVDYGFNEEDEEQLKDAADELIAAGVGRDQKRTDKKQTNKAYLQTVRNGQATRLRARSVLGSVRRRAVQLPGETYTAAVQTIDTALDHGSVAEEDANALAGQLDGLRKVLDDNGTVQEISKKRGGPKAVKDLIDTAGALRAAAQNAAGGRGTPEQTQHLDLVDGIILGLVRGAAEAAGNAAKTLVDPAVASAFALTELYRSPAGGTAKQEEAVKKAPEEPAKTIQQEPAKTTQQEPAKTTTEEKPPV